MKARLMKTVVTAMVAAVVIGFAAYRISLGFQPSGTAIFIGIAFSAITASMVSFLLSSHTSTQRSYLSSIYFASVYGKDHPNPFASYDDPKFLIRTGYDGSDSGRRFGWWVVLGGRRVGALDYLWWDSAAQFWHVYRLTITDPSAEVILRSGDLWCSERVQVESRFVPGFYVDGTLASFREPNLLALRFAAVPEDIFDNPAYDFGAFELTHKSPEGNGPQNAEANAS